MDCFHLKSVFLHLKSAVMYCNQVSSHTGADVPGNGEIVIRISLCVTDESH